MGMPRNFARGASAIALVLAMRSRADNGSDHVDGHEEDPPPPAGGQDRGEDAP